SLWRVTLTFNKTVHRYTPLTTRIPNHAESSHLAGGQALLAAHHYNGHDLPRSESHGPERLQYRSLGLHAAAAGENHQQCDPHLARAQCRERVRGPSPATTKPAIDGGARQHAARPVHAGFVRADDAVQ